MEKLRIILANPVTERVILGLIVINAITLGLETDANVMSSIGPTLHAIDQVILWVFVAEIAARILVHRTAFFRDPWSIFDFIVVAIALIPATGSLSVLRALRVLRVLRLITFLPSLRRVVGALVSALPGMGSIILLLLLILYVGSVMTTKLFGADFPDKFGSIGASAYSLFQIMTLDGWSGELVRPIMELYPFAWLFFIPFILATAFTMLNLFIGVVVNAMQTEHEAVKDAVRQKESENSEAVVLAEIRALRAELAAFRQTASQDAAKQ
jgi:voltage-gated sodium channel